ncbi:MAG TPA: carboxypeptidase-like regulatory domain-containing protein [Longimicrobiales bacterium]|nr:carboxypeptidase-like regulatory domain-containing protein [Longimicrobiales bacterium]
MRFARATPALVLAVFLSVASPLRAQSVVWGTVAGTVTDVAGRPLPGAVLTLSDASGATSLEAGANAEGTFRFALVSPGSYELRAEALGYRPVLARVLTVTGGEERRVALSLLEATPPVTAVDTVAPEAASGRWVAGGTRFGRAEVEAVPHRLRDVSSAAALAPHSSGDLALQGLPAAMTAWVTDGVPVPRAPHPVARTEAFARPLPPRSALAGLGVYGAAPDVEWLGSAGGLLAASTTPGPGDGWGLSGAWSGDPLWSSSELPFDAPSLTSFRGTARGGVEITPGRSGLAVGVDVFREETPLAPRAGDAVLGTLSGLDPQLIEELGAPSTERLSSYSAYLRGDVRRSETSAVFFRGLAAYSRREFAGPGPAALLWAGSPPDESIDWALAGGFTTRSGRSLDLELKAGLSGSHRTFEPAVDARPAAHLAASGHALGVLAAGAGESSRIDLVLSPVANVAAGEGMLKLGVAGTLSRHTMQSDMPQELVFSDGAALVARQGFGRSLDAPEATFTTAEAGAFAQYAFEPRAGLRMSLGARYDYERLPVSDVATSPDWLQAAGVAGDGFASGLSELSASGSLSWDPFLDGRTGVFVAASLEHGDVDPRVLHEALSQDVGATASAFWGSGLLWPAGSLPAGASTLPTLTLLGPDTRAPRSVHATVGVTQRVAAGWSVHLEGSFRRTDFLVRRRDLNLALAPRAVDAYGRAVLGTLQQDGSLVLAPGTDHRRFPAFAEVWALDPDGWSEYQAVTVGLEHSSPGRWLYVAYTRSETTDNWIGAAASSADAELSPGLPEGDAWSEGTSDFDAPDRITAAGSLDVGPVTLSAAYRYRTGHPFTPGYRVGVDANGDGSFRNDVAFVDADLVGPLLDEWPCLEGRLGDFAERNSCRGPAEHALDARVELRVGTLFGREAALVVEGLDLIESRGGILDTALLLVDPAGTLTTSPDGSAVTVPVTVNPDFGRVLYPASRGRQLRVGFRIGA